MEFISITLVIFGPRKGLLPVELPVSISHVVFRFKVRSEILSLMKQSRSAFMEPDYFLASFFLWPLILKIIPALLLISNLCSRPVQQKLCYFFYFMSLWSMVALQGYPGGRNWNLWQIQHTAKFWAAISLVYAEACEESNSMFAGLPSLGNV